MFKRFNLGLRLAIGFAVVLLLSVLMIGFGVQGMRAMHERLQEITTVDNKQARLANAMLAAVNETAIASRDLVLVDEPKERDSLRKALDGRYQDYLRAIGELGKMLKTIPSTPAESQKLFQQVTEAESNAGPLLDEVVKLATENRYEEASKVLTSKLNAPMAAWLASLQQFADFQDKLATDAAGEAEKAYKEATVLMGVLCGVCLFLGIVVARAISISITRPIAEAVRVARTVAGGDLTSLISTSGSDETSQLLLALSGMNDSLAKVVKTVRGSSDSIATGAAEIAAGNADLSRRTESQAASLEQTAASMEQLNTTVQSNGHAAHKAALLATSASTVVSQGGAMMQRVVTTMQDLAASSKRISEITGVIDGIAFQTNILALNANAEAARAGEHGRGFAAVASEVRLLASRAAESAKEIKALVQSSAERTKIGSQLVADTQVTMTDIERQVKQVADLIFDIRTSTDEQTQGIGQVSAALAQLDTVTSQNAALVEESAAAADSLKLQTSRLVEAVSVFKLERPARVVTAPSAHDEVAPFVFPF